MSERLRELYGERKRLYDRTGELERRVWMLEQELLKHGSVPDLPATFWDYHQRQKNRHP